VVDQFSWCKRSSLTAYCAFPSRHSHSHHHHNITAGRLYYLQEGVSVSFSQSSGHLVGDSWLFTAVRCASPLPSGASVTSTVTRRGNPALNQITIVPGYTGTGSGGSSGYVSVYKMPPVYVVQAQDVHTYRLVARNITDLRYRFSVNYTVAGSLNASTGCLSSSAEDWQVEAALDQAYTGLCSVSAGCVSVTRSIDEVRYPAAYVYSIYFESTRFPENFQPNLLLVNATGCNGAQSNATAFYEAFQLSSVSSGTVHSAYTRMRLPIALATTSTSTSFSTGTVPVPFSGVNVTRAPIYKVNGHSWAVTFSSYLGDVPSMTAAPTKYLTDGVSVYVLDNIVPGSLPPAINVTGLATGINRNVRLRSYTRGTHHGYSTSYSAMALTNTTTAMAIVTSTQQTNTSALSRLLTNQTLSSSQSQSLSQSVAIFEASYLANIYGNTSYAAAYSATPSLELISNASTVPSTTPPSLLSFSAEEVLQVNEVQEIIVGAARLLEVQTVTTYAAQEAAAQEFLVSSASALHSIPSTGRFALRFPEIQTIEIRADSIQLLKGKFKLTYSYYDHDHVTNSSGSGNTTKLVLQSETTSCVSVTSSAVEVQRALEDLSMVDNVEVQRSSYGGYTDYVGYTWTISFTGTLVVC
jgi:hypothetical protein